MEDKQLDFNAPLLSVRRFSSTTVSSSEGHNNKKTENSQVNRPYVPPYYKPDLKSGPIRHAGAVPFIWEQIPGRRKDGEVSPDRSVQRPPVAPKLPPGRISENKKQSWDKEFEETIIVSPQVDNGFTNRQKVLPTNGNVSKLQNSKDSKKEKRDCDSEDGDEVYADALDTLSRSESLFFNCTVSGISGLDETYANRLGSSSIDLQSRDFMMDRFLPAAKAMASETPQHASWKQPIPRELPVMEKKVGNGDKRPPVYQSKPYVLQQYVQEPVEDESEDDDYDFGDSSNSSAKACGLIPKFCLKNSFCLLNPVPGMKVKTRAPFPSGRKFNTHVKPAYSGSCNAIDDENNWEAVYKHKLISGLQPLDDESKMTSESNQLTYWSDSQTPDGSSSHMHSAGGGISPFRSEAIQSPFHEGTGFLGIPKQVKSIKTDNSDPYKDSKWGSGSLSPMVEKTLYVDSENVNASISNLSSSDTNGMISSKKKDFELFNDSPAAASPPDVNSLSISQEKSISKTKTSDVGSNILSSSDSLNPGKHVDSMEDFTKGDGLAQESRSLMSLRVRTRRNLEHANSSKEKVQGSSNVYSLQLPLAPPLPKSPSESWLWRTLPSIPSKNGSAFHPRKQSSKAPSTDPKWETIVKTSKVHHGHLRFSEELATPLPQQPETSRGLTSGLNEFKGDNIQCSISF